MEKSDGAEIWRAMPYDEAWAPFDARFHFKPDYYERTTPAIVLPEESIVVDLAPIFAHEGARFAAGEATINTAALRSFVWLADDAELTALAFGHPWQQTLTIWGTPLAETLGRELLAWLPLHVQSKVPR